MTDFLLDDMEIHPLKGLQRREVAGSFANRIILDLVRRPDYECSRTELRETR